MADEKNVAPPDGIEVSEKQEEQPQEDAAEVSADSSAGKAPDVEEPSGSAGDVPQEEQVQEDSKVDNKDHAPQGDSEDAMLTMLNNLPKEDSGTPPEEINYDQTPAAKAEFQQLSRPAGKQEPMNMDLLMDINLPVSIELGRTKMSIAEILGLGPGSVVELNKLAGEPVDVLVNYKLVAKGEVVVIDENFGVRITQLMTPEERLKLLGNEQ